MAHAGGRPTKYKDEYAGKVYKLCLLGATDAEIASFFEEDELTVNRWKVDHPEFCKSLKSGKTDADTNVADRLYQRAMGFEHDSEEIKVIGLEVVRVPIRKIYAPDTTAAIFWLKNRQKNTWRDQRDIDHTTKGEKLPAPILGGASKQEDANT